MRLHGLILTVLIPTILASPVLNSTRSAPYDGFKVHRIIPKTEAQLEAIKNLETPPLTYNFWSTPSFINQNVDVMVPLNLKDHFQNFLKIYNLEDEITVENVQALIDAERPRGGLRPRAPEDFDWTDYRTLEEIYEWLRWLPSQYPDVVEVIIGGTSYEEREIVGVKVSYGPGRKGVFIECGIHAREWIAPATITYILNELLTSTDPEVRDLAEGRDWYFFPSVNPDGYAFTWTSGGRMWRKTRKPYGSDFGADPNRNWDYHWMDGGSSNLPFMDTFAGDEPFSEIETRTLSEYITSVADSLDAYLAFHSSSQYIMTPFGHNGLETPRNHDEMLRIGNVVAKAIYKVHGSRYMVGNIADIIYIASGGSVDWVLGTHRNIRLVYAFELRPAETNFVIPPSNIIESGEEILMGLVEMFKAEPEPGPTPTSPPTDETTPDSSPVTAASFSVWLLIAVATYLIPQF